MGSGNMIVEFFSAEMEFRVWKEKGIHEFEPENMKSWGENGGRITP
jgi:hypothetical protein